MSKLSKDVNEGKFIFNPRNNLFGIIDDQVKAEQAIKALVSSGFAEDEITVFIGEQGAHQIDADGSEHGRLTRIIRWRQSTTPARQDAERYEKAVYEGKYVIAVETNNLDTREIARKILKTHGGHFINFYGRWVIYSLDS